MILLRVFFVATMRCNALFVAVILPASRAVGIAENLATAVNVISGITAEEEYCLSAQGGETMGCVRVRGGSAQEKKQNLGLANFDSTSIAILTMTATIISGEARQACHLIVFGFVALCFVSRLRLKLIRGSMHLRQVVSA